MSGHTPGPWTATKNRVTAPETEDRLGMDARLYGGNGQDNAANARLIAAAPELLEALKEAALWVDGELKNKVHAAIAKATGQ